MPSELRRRLSGQLNRLRSLRYALTTQDIEADVRAIYARVRPHTMTNLPRVHALVRAVDYVVQRNIEGAIVECGAWRGGSVLAMLLRLSSLGTTHYDVYAYDTFEGMTKPGPLDTSPFQEPALSSWNEAHARGERLWHRVFGREAFDLDGVRETLFASGYPPERIHLIKGAVEESLPASSPTNISLLRLDTDWYESTWHELVHLYPRLSPGGVLLVDDYGHWRGCREAVDRYFAGDHASPILLNRIDYTARIGIKA